MRLTVLNLATGLSMLVVCGVAVLWVRSYWTLDVAGVTRQTPNPHSRVVWSANGFITYRHLASPAGSKAVYQSPGWVYAREPAQLRDDFAFSGSNVHRFLGVTYADNTWKLSPRDPLSGEREILLQVPYWLLLALTGALPLARLLSRRQRRAWARRADGLCVHCGYDLPGTPQGRRCPECGTIPDPRP